MRNIAAKVDYSPAAIYSYFASKDDIFHALAEEGFRLLGAAHMTDAPSADPLDDIRLAAWRLYEFSKRQPQYFALVFLDRRVPRIARESERFAFMVEIKNAIRTRMRRCIDEGLFPASLDIDVALRLILVPVFGLVLLQLSGRLLPARRRGRAGARRHRDDDCRSACRRRHTRARRGAAGAQRRGRRSPEQGDPVNPPAFRSQSPPCRRRPRGCALDCRGRLWRQRLAGRGAGRVEARTGARGNRARRTGTDRALPERVGHAGGRGAGRSSGRGRGSRRRHAGGARARRWLSAALWCAWPPTKSQAQAREADANVAQIQARLGQAPTADFDVERVPEVASARANRDLARADFERFGMLYERKLVSKAEYDARQAQADNAERQYESARNGAEQQRQALAGAQARLSLARKAVADTVVRAPFARRGGRAPGVGGRLRDPRHQGGHGDAGQPASGRTDRAGAVHRGRGGGPPGRRSRSIPIPGRASPARCGTCRLVSARTRARWWSKPWCRTRRGC